jgi:hypothetical protein
MHFCVPECHITKLKKLYLIQRISSFFERKVGSEKVRNEKDGEIIFSPTQQLGLIQNASKKIILALF